MLKSFVDATESNRYYLITKSPFVLINFLSGCKSKTVFETTQPFFKKINKNFNERCLL
jgi:hypothetical protein